MQTIEQLSQQVQALSVKVNTQEQELTKLRQQNETLLGEAEKTLMESKLAQEFARKSFRVDHDGWIWRWDVERKLYVKTTSRINTPVIPCGQIHMKNLDKELQDLITGVETFNAVIVDELPEATAKTSKNLYMVRTTVNDNPDYEKFVGVETDGSYSWLSLGYANHVTESQLPMEPVASVSQMWEELEQIVNE